MRRLIGLFLLFLLTLSAAMPAVAGSHHAAPLMAAAHHGHHDTDHVPKAAPKAALADHDCIGCGLPLFATAPGRSDLNPVPPRTDRRAALNLGRIHSLDPPPPRSRA